MSAEDLSKLRIAVVDDEKMLLSVFSSLMRQFHYHADFFSNPVNALAASLADPARYHLVISDIKMPEMDGIEFAKKIRFVLPKMPILFMTGHVSDELREEAMGMGNVEFLEKPFPLESTLKEVIPRFLGL
jgi:DNA-binding NtrC family response regulator